MMAVFLALPFGLFGISSIFEQQTAGFGVLVGVIYLIFTYFMLAPVFFATPVVADCPDGDLEHSKES